MIFDLPEVDIFKDSASLCWIVRHPKTKSIIVKVSFAHLFSWQSLVSSHYADDLFSIIEAGIGLDGWLTPEEIGRIEKAQPGVTLLPPLIDPDNLDSLRKNWVVSSPKSKNMKNSPKKKRSKKKISPSLSGKRKFIL
ncbi:hypothetical protein DRH13_00095 [Candidatus Woesebacteria bacterium]|nr:MAG: hypothetical protein DRH13_00095 [Candidatus Woesebacteria bacterium]